MQFKKYMHVEKYGNEEVDGIDAGICSIFHKLDGSNGSLWINGDIISAGSRRRELSLENDNAGFYAHILTQDNIMEYLLKHPEHRLYGEWLVPHTIKGYTDDSWRKFYVFDVALDKSDDEPEYIPYDIYKELLDDFDISYIPEICRVKNPDYEKFVELLEQCTFNIKDGESGEGIVIKNYDFYNKYGRQVWGKIIRNEFKAKHSKAMGAPIQGSNMVEEKIVEELLSKDFIQKEYDKIVNDEGGWRSQYIPRLLGVVYYEFIKDHCWEMVKKFKNPKIDFKTLNHLVTARIKLEMKEIF